MVVWPRANCWSAALVREEAAWLGLSSATPRSLRDSDLLLTLSGDDGVGARDLEIAARGKGPGYPEGEGPSGTRAQAALGRGSKYEVVGDETQ